MKPQLFRRGLAASLICLMLFLGCNQAQRRGIPCALCEPDSTARLKRAPQPTPEPPEETTVAAVVPAHLAEVKPPDVAPAPVVQTTWREPGQIRAILTARRPPTVNDSVQPRNRAEDYRWLVGELQYVHVRAVWRLRYAGAEEEDRHGGSVTLVETGSMSGFQSGQIVRVEGELVNPDVTGPSPAYRVRLIEHVANEVEDHE